jgi:hypothetical protein
VKAEFFRPDLKGEKKYLWVKNTGELYRRKRRLRCFFIWKGRLIIVKTSLNHCFKIRFTKFLAFLATLALKFPEMCWYDLKSSQYVTILQENSEFYADFETVQKTRKNCPLKSNWPLKCRKLKVFPFISLFCKSFCKKLFDYNFFPNTSTELKSA